MFGKTFLNNLFHVVEIQKNLINISSVKIWAKKIAFIYLFKAVLKQLWIDLIRISNTSLFWLKKLIIFFLCEYKYVFLISFTKPPLISKFIIYMSIAEIHTWISSDDCSPMFWDSSLCLSSTWFILLTKKLEVTDACNLVDNIIAQYSPTDINFMLHINIHIKQIYWVQF